VGRVEGSTVSGDLPSATSPNGVFFLSRSPPPSLACVRGDAKEVIQRNPSLSAFSVQMFLILASDSHSERTERGIYIYIYIYIYITIYSYIHIVNGGRRKREER